ncbi:MAG: hypothetical protein AAFO07_25945, partial [Bacteroidota bacterium]
MVKSGFTGKRDFSIIAILLFLLILGMLGMRYFFAGETNSTKDWNGVWEISYFYENEPHLIYEGRLKLVFEDTVKAELILYPPKGTRSEIVEIADLQWDETTLNGTIIHTSYKINEGHLQENFELKLEEAGKFLGSGRCV